MTGMQSEIEKSRVEMDAKILTAVFQQAVEQADIAISITDVEANILYVNPVFERLTGYLLEEISGKNQSLLSNKATPRHVYENLWKQISEGIPWGVSGQP